MKYEVVPPEYMQRKAKVIDVNFENSNKSRVYCLIKGSPFDCCADSGAHNSIISSQFFYNLIIDNTYLDRKQTFNIRTATGLEKNAVRGIVELCLTFSNVDHSTQSLQKRFLVLKQQLDLMLPLLGYIFFLSK